MKVSVICMADRPERLPLLYWSLVAQTHDDWELIVLDQRGDRDGIATYEYLPADEPPVGDLKVVTVANHGDWGQTVKEAAAMDTSLVTGGALLFPADDAYYAPIALAEMVKYIDQGHQLVICGWLYDKMGYQAMPPRLEQGYIDVGGFMVEVNLFRKVGWRDKSQTGDFTLASDLAEAAGSCINYSGVLYVKN